ncbi:esterase/lipase family protein [Tundrisphaera sp. TA3]|uniref:esterase/lipase family protein n=1 Tax=Tundrisphaera sp. TA3 TaxID=3435775 RepID=UPI003EBA091E
MAWAVLGWLALIGAGGPQTPPDRAPISVRVEFDRASEIDVAEVVTRLASALGVPLDRPPTPLRLPVAGLAAPLARTLLAETLGPDAGIEVRPDAVVFTLRTGGAAASRDDWARRLRDLSDRADREAQRRSKYGMHPRPSYRPDDPARPTVCLIHGLNSTSGVFAHFFKPLEDAGYGIVNYDFPYNRDLDETSEAFARDWAAFRRERGDRRPWGIVAHSMGSLLARSYVEGDAYEGDVASLILIAPPNHGSALAQGQTLLQMTQGLRSVQGSRPTDPLAVLGDGLGAAADDMMPGSAYLGRLNRRPRRGGIRYHIVAGDVGYLSASARRQIDARASGGGLLGGIGRMALAGTSGALEAITDGRGDGCVSVASTRLPGVADHRVMHANHLELIRAPLLFPDPGPVMTMPDILRWLAEDLGR